MHPSSKPRILILGAGCTGLGAAWRLHELGHDNFLVLERNAYPGGLSASFVDPKGFTWDIGGHVLFSRYDYFDRVIKAALNGAWYEHVRRASVRICDRFIPYPLQNNLRFLPPEPMLDCLLGLIRVRDRRNHPPADFRDWLLATFGQGLCDHFLFPYNLKVWAHALEQMSYGWNGPFVAPVDLEQTIADIVLAHDNSSWGINSTFRFPQRGGTGAIWRAVSGLVPPSRLRLNTEITSISLADRTVETAAGERFAYDFLVSSAPLDLLGVLTSDSLLASQALQLAYSTTHVVGVGLRGECPEPLRGMCWMYFPEPDCPFYRVTVLSNYSPHNVPTSAPHWSLMAEIAASPYRPADRASLVSATVQGLICTGLIASAKDIVSTWTCTAERGYPVPTLDRDEHVTAMLHHLEAHGIYSRGRFGGWKYEVSSQDHSFMQGVEVADRLSGQTRPDHESRHPNPPVEGPCT
jgi:protoporphyrinogen oxidase